LDSGGFNQNDQIQLLQLDAMPPKRFPDHPFNSVSVNCPRKRSLACNNAKSGVFSAATSEENLEIFVPDIIAMDNMIKPVFAQQPVSYGKFASSDWLVRQRVLHGL
jgi:hypothetical protein